MMATTTTTTSTNSSSFEGNNHQNSIKHNDNEEVGGGSGGGLTICWKCKGEGKLIQPPSRKARKRHKLNNNNNNNSNSKKSPPPPPRIDGCKICQGSGLLVGGGVGEKQTSCSSSSSAADLFQKTRKEETVPPVMMPPPPPPAPPIHVAIIGGGLGGLALAVACHHRSIPVTVYERDTNFHQRSQGYGLTMQQASRILASLGIPIPLRDGIISTKHVVHTPEGRVVGEWGLRKWLSPKEQQQRRQQAQTNNTSTTCSTSNASSHNDESSSSRNQIFNKSNNNNNKNKRQNVHIARQSLRMELLKALGGESKVEWGHKLVNFTQHEDRVDLVFDVVVNTSSQQQQQQSTITTKTTKEESNNNDDDKGDIEESTDTTTRTTPQQQQRQQKKTTATLLVGADGIRSSVRKQWLGEEMTPLRYLGCIVILGICPLQSPSTSTTSATAMTAMMGPSSSSSSPLLDGETVFQTADGSTRIYMMPYSNMDYMWQLSFPMTEQEAKKLSNLGPQALKDESLKRCNSWHDPIIPILQHTPVELVSGYPVYDRDLLTKEIIQQESCGGGGIVASSTTLLGDSTTPGAPPPARRVTLLGDACHPMSPFKGQGANQALLDALSLARILYKEFQKQQQDDDDDDDLQRRQTSILNSVLETYEDEMLSRSSVKVKASAEAARFLHTEIAIQEGNVTRGTAAALLSTNNTH